jgi:hypothetical protein
VTHWPHESAKVCIAALRDRIAGLEFKRQHQTPMRARKGNLTGTDEVASCW